jgi:hypothetical protein
MNPATAYIVGVRVTFNYAVEKMPDNQETGTNDIFTNSVLFYYLELDSSKRVIGGEWRAQKHVNFMWGPYRPTDEYIMTEDRYISKFSGAVNELANMTNFALSASARGSPLRALMKYLTAQASA